MKRPCQEESLSDTGMDPHGTIVVGKEEEKEEECSRSASPTTISQAQARKKRRGVIEKRRRDRINSSLSELRHLLPTAFEKQGSSKLEKAEILQMTVDHLKMLHAIEGTGFLDARALAVDYRALGFRECLTEVVRYLGTFKGKSSTDPLQLRLLSHLNNCVAEMEPPPLATSSLLPFQLWPRALLHKFTQLPLPRRECTSGLAVLAASSVVYPGPMLRAAPVCQIPNALTAVCPSTLLSRTASPQMGKPLLEASSTPSIASGERMREVAAASRSSQYAAFLFSSSSFSARGPVAPVDVSPHVLNPSAQGPGNKNRATARLCHSWTTEIGAF